MFLKWVKCDCLNCEVRFQLLFHVHDLPLRSIDNVSVMPYNGFLSWNLLWALLAFSCIFSHPQKDWIHTLMIWFTLILWAHDCSQQVPLLYTSLSCNTLLSDGCFYFFLVRQPWIWSPQASAMALNMTPSDKVKNSWKSWGRPNSMAFMTFRSILLNITFEVWMM